MTPIDNDVESLQPRSGRLSGVMSVPFGRVHLIADVLFIMVATLSLAPLDAADRVWLEPARPTSSQSTWFPRSVEIVSGRIVAFDSQQLRLVREGQGTETVTSAGRVLWIEPDEVSDLEQKLIHLFKQGEYARSLSELRDALNHRPPVWRQQWLTMLSATSAWKSGNAKLALELVGQLDRRPLPAMVLAWLPIAWTNGAQPAVVIATAQARLQDTSTAVRLVAASWLLSSPDRNQGLAVINQLKQDPRIEIAQIAEVLSWRMTPPPQVAKLSSTWEKRIDTLPLALQTGPSRLLVNKLEASGQSESAKRLQWSLELTPVYALGQINQDQQ
jgi:hypothetical protein|tara:strand:+ start:127 stop:1116 length:990 start_codon:yes stop_codon:yes gene_type:complete